MNDLKQNIKKNEEKKKDDITAESSTVNGININDININDIEENINDDNEKKTKKNGNTIEYYLFDVESYNSSNNRGVDSFVDLSSIRSSYLSENRKKKAKKKRGSYLKKQLKIYKKKYKILPEHNLDQDTNYENSMKNDIKEYKIYDMKDIKEDNGVNDSVPSKRKDFIIKKDVFVNVIFFSKVKSTTNLTRKEYIKYIISISALSGLSVVTGNSAYSYLEIPVISVIKSSSLILIYFLSIKFGLKEFKCSLLCSILTILLGVIMSITTLKIDSLFGIFLLVISVIASSFKWVFTNVLLRSTTMKPHIILLHIYQVALFIINYNSNLLTIEQIFTSLFLVSVGALTSIFLILAEFSLISCTSSVTLSIVFIGREAIILIIGSIFFGENVNFSSSIGIAISMIGTILYGYASK
ncbi:triose or hexose phosphate/phosphate translocator [Plasmodium brasilianum]|uniref:Triose or hexose phosphate/phosphate translocator n=1 Tax=Plasmodium brasilianum TaxID=5824 RepID=A0ACB9Y2Z0_PLABR|nr:triose or hexose phosphate/phosphate translocator [Plasmodium brasilianum]